MKTPRNKPKSIRKTPKRRRKLPYVYSGDYRLADKLMAILHEGDPRLTVYVYRAEDCRRVGPYILKCCPYEGLEEDIRDRFGSGQYAIMIRGKTMEFAGVIGVEAPRGWQPPKQG